MHLSSIYIKVVSEFETQGIQIDDSGQKFDNSLHSNALFLIFIFTFEIKTFFFMLKTICKRTIAGAATLFYQCSLL